MEPTTKIKSYKDLLVWQKALSLVKLSYKATKEFPADISTELGFVNPDNAQPLFNLIEEFQKMLNSLRTKLAAQH